MLLKEVIIIEIMGGMWDNNRIFYYFWKKVKERKEKLLVLFGCDVIFGP